MQGTWVCSLVRGRPTCREASKPMRHDYGACIPNCGRPGVRILRCTTREWHGEKPKHCNGEQLPLTLTPRKAHTKQHPAQPKKKNGLCNAGCQLLTKELRSHMPRAIKPMHLWQRSHVAAPWPSAVKEVISKIIIHYSTVSYLAIILFPACSHLTLQLWSRFPPGKGHMFTLVWGSLLVDVTALLALLVSHGARWTV